MSTQGTSRVGIIQSSYIPWRGYFDFIQSVDHFVFYDDIQYSKGGWRNRNKLKAANGTMWITVPIELPSSKALINEVKISRFSKGKALDWQSKHINLINENYRKAPYLNDVLGLLYDAYQYKDETLSQLNIRLTKSICEYLGIKTKFWGSQDLSTEGCKTERLIAMLKKLDASHYLSGPSADAYLDKLQFEANNIVLEYKSYDYPAYPQLWGKFDGAVSILDLLANCGGQSRGLLRSTSDNTVVKAEY
ncbi:MAG: WbqC family protein [Gallionella sp.]|nr:WbqC family protein [Gallionella sp.]